VHFNVPEEKPKDAHVLPCKSELSQLSLTWLTTLSPQTAAPGAGPPGFDVQLLKLRVQSLLQTRVPPENALNEVHVLPSRFDVSHCSMKPAEFGFWMLLSPQNVGEGLAQVVVSYLHVLVHFNEPLPNPNDAHVLPLRSEPSQLSPLTLTTLSPHLGSVGPGGPEEPMHADVSIWQLTQLNVPEIKLSEKSVHKLVIPPKSFPSQVSPASSITPFPHFSLSTQLEVEI